MQVSVTFYQVFAHEFPAEKHRVCVCGFLQSGNHGRVCAAGAMEPLVQLAAGAPRRYILLRDDGTIDVEGMSDPLRELRLDEEMIRLLGYDVDCRRYVTHEASAYCFFLLLHTFLQTTFYHQNVQLIQGGDPATG